MTTNDEPLDATDVVIAPTRTADAWWAWHDADSSRWSADMDEAEARCIAWVEGESSDGPEA